MEWKVHKRLFINLFWKLTMSIAGSFHIAPAFAGTGGNGRMLSRRFGGLGAFRGDAELGRI